MCFCAVLMPGVINRVKAFWAGRRGASIFQPFYDIVKLLKKSEVLSNTASPVFVLAPTAALAALITAGLFIPVSGGRAIFYFSGDFVFFAYLMAAARFFTIIGALDTGSSFSGMGAAREASFSALIEPAFFIVLGSFCLLTGFNSFTDVFLLLPARLDTGGDFIASFQQSFQAWFTSGSTLFVPAVCGNFVLLLMLLTESSRIPVDDPDTHLELTMIHEVMVLDYSGPGLAYIHLAAVFKMTLLGTLITGIIIPSGVHPAAGFVMYVFFMALIALTVGTLESVMSRLRMNHVPQFILGASSVALIVLAVLLLGGVK
jgi:formate hydrogenlyase subunit 4